MPVQGVAWRVQLVATSTKFEWEPVAEAAGPPLPVSSRQLHHLADQPVMAPVYERSSLGAGARIAGPAIIREDLSTILVMPGQQATVGRHGELVIEVQS
jgi:N-methylhydantoinase A